MHPHMIMHILFIFRVIYLSYWLMRTFGYKGTTKNAHMQAKRVIICKKDRFIYLIRYSAHAQTCLKAKC